MLEIGAHHVWWPLLQALFMIAKPLPAMSSTSATINKGAFMCGLHCGAKKKGSAANGV